MSTTYMHPQGHVFYRKLAHPRPMIDYGEGVYLYDTDGKRYLDGAGGPFVVNVGHGRQKIADAMQKQAQQAAYVHANMFTSDVIERYSERLAPLIPVDDPRFFFVTSGSEAIEGAIKLARQIQIARGESGRHQIISRHQSYHGMSLGALAASGRPSLRAPYQEMMRTALHVDPPYPYRDQRTGADFAAQLEALIQHEGAHTIAAFIAEPVSGAGLGAVVPPDDYWSAIKAVCERHSVLLIIDEVFTGMGRTGKWWGIDHWDLRPDILVTSKGIAGGYFPLGMFATSRANVDQIQQTLGDFNHGGTFSHHAVGAAAALATLDIIEHENLVARSATMGQRLGELLHEALSDHPHVGDIRGRGLCWGVEFVQDKASKQPFAAREHIAGRVWQAAFDRGVSLYYASGCVDGYSGDLSLLGPPYIITDDQLDELVAGLRGAMQDVFGS